MRSLSRRSFGRRRTGWLLLVVYLGLLLVWWVRDPAIVRENALMENLQAAALTVGCLAACAGLVLPRRRYPRLVFFAMVVFLLGLFLREVDIDRLGLPDFLVLLGSGTGRNLLLAGGALVVAAGFARNVTTLRPVVVSLLKERAFSPFYWGVALYLVGESFDKKLFPLARGTSLFAEELCENAATYCFLWGALAVLALTGRATTLGYRRHG